MTEKQNQDYRPSVTDPGAHWDRLVTCAYRLTNAERGVLAAVDDGEVTPIVTVPTSSEYNAGFSPLDIQGIESVYTDNRACIIPDIADKRSTAVSAPQTQSFRDRSLLAVPVPDVGILCVTTGEPDAFTDTDQTQVQWLVDTVLQATEEKDVEDSREIERPDLSIASVFAHDIQNPLQLARGYLELAEKSGDPEHYQTILTALDRIETIAKGLASLARAEEQISNRVPVELEAAAREAWTTVEAPEATLDVSGECTILANQDTFQQLLENLFQNAVAHAGADVTVKVGCQQNGFYIEDDGPGIPDQDREQVFEWRYSSAGRSGIGLSIVKRIAYLHEWDLQITDGKTGGARFEFHTDQSARVSTPTQSDTA